MLGKQALPGAAQVGGRRRRLALHLHGLALALGRLDVRRVEDVGFRALQGQRALAVAVGVRVAVARVVAALAHVVLVLA